MSLLRNAVKNGATKVTALLSTALQKQHHYCTSSYSYYYCNKWHA